MDRDLFLESALACRAGGDSVECYKRRTRTTALSFDGRATGTPCRSESEEFAVRVYRQGRLGVAGSSSGSIADWSDLVGRAEANARHGAPVGAFSFVSRKSAGKCVTPLASAELVEGLRELRSRLLRDGLVVGALHEGSQLRQLTAGPSGYPYRVRGSLATVCWAVAEDALFVSVDPELADLREAWLQRGGRK